MKVLAWHVFPHFFWWSFGRRTACPVCCTSTLWPSLPAGSQALWKWQYMMSMLSPNTCSVSSFCQLHISIYKLSPSALQYHVGVVSSVCFYFAILLHWVILNTGESALIRDQPSLKLSFITVESWEEPHNHFHPHQGWVFAWSIALNLLDTRSVLMLIRCQQHGADNRSHDTVNCVMWH